jgi:hypothetical protein
MPPNRNLKNLQCDNKGIPIYHDGPGKLCDELGEDYLTLFGVGAQVDRLRQFIHNSDCFENVKDKDGKVVGRKLKKDVYIEVWIETYEGSDQKRKIGERPIRIGEWGPLPTEDGQVPDFDPFDPVPDLRKPDYKPRDVNFLPIFNPRHKDSPPGEDKFVPDWPELTGDFLCEPFDDSSGSYWEIFNCIYYYYNNEVESNLKPGNTIEVNLNFNCNLLTKPSVGLPSLGDFPSLDDIPDVNIPIKE